MNTQTLTPTVRFSRREGWYVPQVNGVDLPVTTFDESRAWQLAREAARQSLSR